MSFKLINCQKAYELGPVTISRLKREEAAARAMGNHSGANILKSQHEAAQARWDAYWALHRTEGNVKSDRELTTLDTPGL